MHTDYSPPPSALHIIGNQSPLSFHLEANAFKAIKLLTIYLNLKEPNETSLQDEIDFALWLSCTCDTLGNVNFSISDWRSVSQLCDAAVSHRGEDAAALTFKVKLKVTYSQVCWPTLGIRALHLPIQAHTQQWTCTHSSEHTHTVNTYPEQWAAINAVAPGEHLRVRCLSQGHLVVVLRVERAVSHWQSLLDLRLKLTTFGLRVRLSTIRPRLPRLGQTGRDVSHLLHVTLKHQGLCDKTVAQKSVDPAFINSPQKCVDLPEGSRFCRLAWPH